MLVAIVGIILFVGLGLTGTNLLGQEFELLHNKSKAQTLIAEGSQIRDAYELYKAFENNNMTNISKEAQLPTLQVQGYLKAIPKGIGSQWLIGQDGIAMTAIGEREPAKNICVQARRSLKIPNPDIVFACDDPAISINDPCCLTE